jgi:p-hydroxybenzoate 3-monooxygenase
MTVTERAAVGIVGAGPAGLVLSHLLARAGIGSVVIELHDRAHVESRVRAGVLEHGTVELLDDLGLSERLHREGDVHRGVNLQFDGERHRIDFEGLTGKSITVYGQQEVVKDLIAARLRDSGAILFRATDAVLSSIDSDQPLIEFDQGGTRRQLVCDWVAGCDGHHGVSRPSIPPEALRIYEHEYPMAWLGILAAVAPSTDELIYSHHQRGFALHSLRSPSLSRLYIQVDPADDIDDWPDERIWAELQLRLASPGWTLQEGPVIEKAISPMRSFVAEPMRYGRLFLAGDAAHIVPPTGAKGLNLAVADVKVLADALIDFYATGDTTAIDEYSDQCLARVWRVQDFSTMMTDLLHRHAGDDDFARRVQRARQEYVCTSDAMARSLAENYVGFELP